MKLKKLYKSIVYGSLAASLSLGVQAQDSDSENQDAEIEEIVVTGSFIKRDKFDMASPVESIDAVDIQNSGYTNIGPYIRDLTYTANVDTVANVLSVADGIQDSVSARFNLRGLGTSSTLTLFDGRRVLNSGAVASILPDIALQRVEVILDGGAATYGTDAVAGVVNMIPKKDFEGAQVRSFYTRDAEGDSDEVKLAALFGREFDKLHIVSAIEYSEREDAIYRSDRPEYLRADNDSSTSGNPGSFSGTGFSPFVPSLQFGLDPECGSNANGMTDDGVPGAYPSGIPALPIVDPTTGTVFKAAAVCTFEYGAYQDYKRPNEDLIFYLGATYELNDNVTFEMLLNHNDRTSTLVGSPSTSERGANDLMDITTAHPNSPFGFTVQPRGWRPFSNNGATQPSHLNSHGSDDTDFNFVTTSLALGSEFSLGGTGWTGETYVTLAETTTDIKGHALNLDRLTLALQGQGGINSNQWFNPFFSASPLSASYGDCEAGTGTDTGSGNTCSANNQQLVDWLYTGYDYQSSDTDYWSVEGVATGDLFELPAGTLAMAVGAQFRETELFTQSGPLDRTPSEIHTTASSTGDPASQNYNATVVNGIGGSTQSESAVASAFVEFLAPITDDIEVTFAARHENFRDLDISATVPKLSVRYQPLENLSLRTSYGEGFLAPTNSEITRDPSPSCLELFSGNDPVLGGSLTGQVSCSDGNPELDPEESTIFNVGATWKVTEDFDVSLDYQQIDYEDRIIRLGSTDTLRKDFANFLQANDLTQTEWDALSSADKLAEFQPWINSPGEDPGIIRNPTTGAVQQVTRIPNNVAAVEVDVVDFRLNYGTTLDNWGYLSANWSTTWYTKYDYKDAFGNTQDAAGKQNADTDIAPPLSEKKHQLRLSWLLDNHFVGFTIKHQDEMEFDATIGPAFPPGVGYTGPTNGLGTAVAPDKIDAHTVVDFRYGYTFEDVFDGQFEFALGSNDLFDEGAQALPIEGGLETRTQDPTGRTYYIEGTYSF